MIYAVKCERAALFHHSFAASRRREVYVEALIARRGRMLEYISVDPLDGIPGSHLTRRWAEFHRFNDDGVSPGSSRGPVARPAGRSQRNPRQLNQAPGCASRH